MSTFPTTMRQRVNVASKATRSAAVVPSRHMVQQRRGPAPARGVQFSDQFMEVLSKSLEREESRVRAAGTLATDKLLLSHLQQYLAVRKLWPIWQ
jgi:hypothetical protein